MTDRSFRVVPVRRADFGPSQSGAEIVCGRCRERDQVVNSTALRNLPPAMAAQRFRAAGWRVGSRDRDDRCPKCVERETPARKEFPMVVVKDKPAAPKALSEDAILGRKVVYDALFANLDVKEKRYLPGWSDEKVATAAAMSVAFVKAFREANFFAIAEDVPPAAMTSFRAALAGDLDALQKAAQRVAAASSALQAAERDLVAVEGIFAARVKAFDTLIGKGA